MFQLTKWYLDLATDQGTAVIIYAAFLRWGRLRVHYASTLMVAPFGPLDERVAWTGVAPPREHEGALRISHAGLRLVGEWRAEAAPIEATLLDNASGQLRWTCVQPSATATLELAGQAFTGRGYAECLRMTCLPWALPFRTLRWGRFNSPGHSVVWIGWSGGEVRQWIWVDGQNEPLATLSADEIGNLNDGQRLSLVPERELCDRHALRVISRRLPALDPLLIGPIRNLRETKRLARGILYRSSEPVSQGWVIHEVVTW